MRFVRAFVLVAVFSIGATAWAKDEELHAPRSLVSDLALAPVDAGCAARRQSAWRVWVANPGAAALRTVFENADEQCRVEAAREGSRAREALRRRDRGAAALHAARARAILQAAAADEELRVKGDELATAETLSVRRVREIVREQMRIQDEREKAAAAGDDPDCPGNSLILWIDRVPETVPAVEERIPPKILEL